MSEEEEKRPEWMTKISSIVDPKDYLLGRKIDKTFELSAQEKVQEAKEKRLEMIASGKIKLPGDPMRDLERKRQEIRMEILSNPVKLKQLREHLLRRKQEENGDQQSTPSTSKLIEYSRSSPDHKRGSHPSYRERSRSTERRRNDDHHRRKNSPRPRRNEHVDKHHDSKERRECYHSREHERHSLERRRNSSKSRYNDRGERRHD